MERTYLFPLDDGQIAKVLDYQVVTKGDLEDVASRLTAAAESASATLLKYDELAPEAQKIADAIAADAIATKVG